MYSKNNYATARQTGAPPDYSGQLFEKEEKQKTVEAPPKSTPAFPLWERPAEPAWHKSGEAPEQQTTEKQATEKSEPAGKAPFLSLFSSVQTEDLLLLGAALLLLFYRDSETLLVPALVLLILL